MDVAKFSDQIRPLAFLDTSAWVFIGGICVGKFSCTGHNYDVSHLLENEPINKATNDYFQLFLADKRTGRLVNGQTHEISVIITHYMRKPPFKHSWMQSCSESQKPNFSPEPSSTHTPLGCVSEQLRLCLSLAKTMLFRKLKKIAHVYLVAGAVAHTSSICSCEISLCSNNIGLPMLKLIFQD